VRIAVCVRRVPYLGTPFEIDKQSGLVRQKGTEAIFVTNPDDRSALEESLGLRDEICGEVVVITVGSVEAKKSLYTCLACGADKVIHVLDKDGRCGDAYTTALALSRILASLHCGLIMCGTRSSDEGNAQVPAAIAELLSLPHVTSVIKMEFNGKQQRIRAVRRLEHGRREVVECPLPAVVGVEAGIREPRYISVQAYQHAVGQEIETRPVASLFSNAQELEPFIRVTKLFEPRPRPKKMSAPDSSMSPTERFRFIMSGGIGQKDGNIMMEGQIDKLVKQLIEVLRNQGAI
jgi:electron transfer flavoprotein beta subunit